MSVWCAQGVNKEEACRLAVEAVEALAADCADARRPPDAAALASNAPGTDVAAHAERLRRLQDLQLPDKVRPVALRLPTPGRCRTRRSIAHLAQTSFYV